MEKLVLHFINNFNRRIYFVQLLIQISHIFCSDKRKPDEATKEEPSSPKRSKRLSPSPGPQSSSSSESDGEKPVSAFYQSLLESSYAADGMNKLISNYNYYVKY